MPGTTRTLRGVGVACAPKEAEEFDPVAEESNALPTAPAFGGGMVARGEGESCERCPEDPCAKLPEDAATHEAGKEPNPVRGAGAGFGAPLTPPP